MTTNILLIGRTGYDLNPDATLPTDSKEVGNPKLNIYIYIHIYIYIYIYIIRFKVLYRNR